MQHFVGRIWQGRTGTADLHELYSICSLARDLPPHCFSLLHFSTSSAFGSGSTGQAKQLNTAVLYGRQEPKKNTEESRQGGISCCASVSLLECCGAFMSSICAGFFPQFIYHLIQQKSPEQRGGIYPVYSTPRVARSLVQESVLTTLVLPQINFHMHSSHI